MASFGVTAQGCDTFNDVEDVSTEVATFDDSSANSVTEDSGISDPSLGWTSGADYGGQDSFSLHDALLDNVGATFDIESNSYSIVDTSDGDEGDSYTSLISNVDDMVTGGGDESGSYSMQAIGTDTLGTDGVLVSSLSYGDYGTNSLTTDFTDGGATLVGHGTEANPGEDSYQDVSGSYYGETGTYTHAQDGDDAFSDVLVTGSNDAGSLSGGDEYDGSWLDSFSGEAGPMTTTELANSASGINYESAGEPFSGTDTISGEYETGEYLMAEYAETPVPFSPGDGEGLLSEVENPLNLLDSTVGVGSGYYGSGNQITPVVGYDSYYVVAIATESGGLPYRPPIIVAGYDVGGSEPIDPSATGSMTGSGLPGEELSNVSSLLIGMRANGQVSIWGVGDGVSRGDRRQPPTR